MDMMERTPMGDTNPPSTIGSATMKADGTIELLLRAEASDGAFGDAMFTYPLGHADYRMVLDHVGGLEPGESKAVPPWPEDG